MKKYLSYLLWFVPVIFFIIFSVLGFFSTFFVIKNTTKADWITILPLVTGPLGLLCSYGIFLPYIRGNNNFSQKFKTSYVSVSLTIFAVAFVAMSVWGVYALFHDLEATPQGMGG